MMEELEICMRCGFCRAECPVFSLDQSELRSARGKIAMIRAIDEGELKVSQSIYKRIFECTLCGRCAEECPAGVDTIGLFLKARSRLYPDYAPLKKKTALKMLDSPVALNLASKVTIKKGARRHRPMESAISKEGGKNKVILFKGCLGRYFKKDISRSAVKVLKHHGFEVIEINEHCCGLPHLYSGDISGALKQASSNLRLLEMEGVEAIITICPSCQQGLQAYPDLVEDNKSIKVAEKTYGILEFLRKKDLLDGSYEDKGKTCTYHEPCHDRSGLTWDILKKVKGLKLAEMNEQGGCCGFGGLFTIDNPQLSSELGERKMENILKTKADTVVTPCPGCILNIERMALKVNTILEVRHPIEILADWSHLEIE